MLTKHQAERDVTVICCMFLFFFTVSTVRIRTFTQKGVNTKRKISSEQLSYFNKMFMNKVILGNNPPGKIANPSECKDKRTY